MTHSNAYAELMIDRLRPARDVVASAWMTLDAIRNHDPVQAGVIGDLPERLAVLEGLLEHTGDLVVTMMSSEQYEAWRMRRDAT